MPFLTGFDFSVFDHLKYMEVSNAAFPVSAHGSVEFSSDMTRADAGDGDRARPAAASSARPAPGRIRRRRRRHAELLGRRSSQGQQAGVVINMVDFCTGQLFDWFLAGNTAFTLIERLPTNVTGNTANPDCPGATTSAGARCTPRSSTR